MSLRSTNAVRKFAGKTLIYAGGNLLQKSSQLLLIPLYTRVLSPAEYGFYGAVLAIVGVIGPLIDLGVSSSLVRFIHEHYDNPTRLAVYLKLSFWLRLGSTVLVSFICGLLLIAGWNWIFDTDPVSINAAWWIILAAAGGVLVDFACAYYQAFHQAFMFVVGKVGQTALQLILVLIALLSFNLGVMGVIAAQAIGAIVAGAFVMICFYLRNLAPHKGRVEWSDLRHNLSYGLPLVPHRLGNWLRSASDRVILSKFLPLATVGIYQLAYSVGNALSVLVSCLDLAFAPMYYRIRKTRGMAETAEIFRAYSSCYIVVLGGVCLFVILFCGEIISLLAPPDYGRARSITPLIVFAIFLQGQYTLAVKPLFYHKKTGWVPILTLGPAVLGSVANFWLIPKFGVMVAAWTTVAMYLLTFVSVTSISSKLERIGFPVALTIVANITVASVAIYMSTRGGGIWEWSAISYKVLIGLLVTGAGAALAVLGNVSMLRRLK